MTEKKSNSMTAINFRCSSELKIKLEILQFATQKKDISSLLIELCEKFVEVNASLIESIENVRQSACVKLPFESTKKKSAPRKKTNKPTPITNAGDDNVGDSNAEN